MPLVQFRGGDYFMLFLAKNPPPGEEPGYLFHAAISCSFSSISCSRDPRGERRRVRPLSGLFSFDHHFCLTQGRYIATDRNKPSLLPVWPIAL